MAIPPRVTADDAAAAVQSIAERRQQIDDPNAWRLSDDPLEVLAYLRRYSAGIPRWVAQADVLDGLTLRLRLYWLGEESELWLLERAKLHGVAPRYIARQLGLTSRQGVHDRRRLAREKVSKLRGTEYRTQDHRSDQRGLDVEQSWLRTHRTEILRVANEATGFRDLADDEAAEWLTDVAADARDGVVTPGSVQTLRFALIELAGSAAVRSANDDHPVHGLLLRWSQLYQSSPRHS